MPRQSCSGPRRRIATTRICWPWVPTSPAPTGRSTRPSAHRQEMLGFLRQQAEEAQILLRRRTPQAHRACRAAAGPPERTELMKNFSFRLERVLQLRLLAEQAQARRLADARQAEAERRLFSEAGAARVAEAIVQMGATPAELRTAGTLSNLMPDRRGGSGPRRRGIPRRTTRPSRSSKQRSAASKRHGRPGAPSSA